MPIVTKPNPRGRWSHLVHDEHGFGSLVPNWAKKFFERSFRCLEGEITYIEFHDIAIWFLWGHRQFSEHQAQTAYRYTTFKLRKIAF